MKRSLPWYFWLGLSGFLVSQGIMIAKIEPVSTYFYAFIWWFYIILVDSLVFWRRGSSLFTRLKVKVLLLVISSYLFWGFFELLNLRISNWSYTGPSLNLGVKIVFTILAFGSVLPGILETHELLQLFSPSKKLDFLKWQKWSNFFHRKWWGHHRYLWTTAGVVMFIISLVWPKYFFWTIWIAGIFLLDPDVEKNGGKSLLSELREGNIRTLSLLLLTGFLCGVLWEFWNYWAGLKWVYNVSFFGEWKIFEMPFLGYLGFLPFALECYIFYNWLGCQKVKLDKIVERLKFHLRSA